MTLSQVTLPSSPNSSLQFLACGQSNDPQASCFVEEMSKTCFQPVYGDEHACSAFWKIQTFSDRCCEIIQLNQTLVGCWVYKTELQNRFVRLGVQNSFEVKHCWLTDQGIPHFYSVIQRMKEVARQMSSHSMHICLSEGDQKMLSFFQENFHKVCTWLPISHDADYSWAVHPHPQHLLVLDMPSPKGASLYAGPQKE